MLLRSEHYYSGFAQDAYRLLESYLGSNRKLTQFAIDVLPAARKQAIKQIFEFRIRSSQ